MVKISPSVDWDQILAPVSKELPAGEFLIYDGIYDKIKEDRREDNALLDQGVWKTDLKQAEWEEVESTCLDTLMFRSKDLQVAAWLMESWIHLYEFKGVWVGLELLLRLSQEFWEDIFPLAEGEDLEARVSPFIWLNEKLDIKLKLVPMSRMDRDEVSYKYSDWETATQNENLIRKNKLEELGQENPLTQKRFLENCVGAPRGFFPEQREALVGTLGNLEVLGQFLDEKCGKTSPSLQRFKEVLQSILRLVEKILNMRGEQASAIPAEDSNEDVPMEKKPEPAVTNNAKEEVQKTYSGKISSREEAYQALKEAAQYLEVNEPHSPTPNLIRRAVAWGSMSFAQLLAELVREPQDMRVVYDILGLNPYSETDNPDNETEE